MNMKNNLLSKTVLAICIVLSLPQLSFAQTTIRGDFNMDGSVNLTDVTTMTSYLLNDRMPFPEPVKDTVTVNGASFVMVYVEGGFFRLQRIGGNTYIVPSFTIGQTEVTQELWEAVMGDLPSVIARGPQQPVDRVSGTMCEEFIARLNELTGKTFRLPTETEWMYAASGGRFMRGYRYSGSNDLDQVAWFSENTLALNPPLIMQPVGTKAPNELGLYDMNGNVSEWCERIVPSVAYRRTLGGSICSYASECLISASITSNALPETDVVSMSGLRLVMTAE